MRGYYVLKRKTIYKDQTQYIKPSKRYKIFKNCKSENVRRGLKIFNKSSNKY